MQIISTYGFAMAELLIRLKLKFCLEGQKFVVFNEIVSK